MKKCLKLTLSDTVKRWNHDNHELLQQMVSIHGKGDFSDVWYILGNQLTAEIIIKLDNMSDEQTWNNVGI